MDQVAALVEHYFSGSDGELHIGGIPVSTIIACYGTPLFIYDRSIINRKLALLHRTLPPEFAISYSVKANPNRTILQHFIAQGCGLEIASGGEFHLALCAGCPPHKIIFAGPGKTEAELELVLTHGIGEIHVESLVEIERVSAMSRRLGMPARIAVRVNPSGEVQGGAMRMGGKPSPFGVDEEQLDEVLARISWHPTLEFQGIHLYSGTQILDYTVLVRQYRKALAIARRVAARLQQPLRTVDFGGGLGIPYFAHDQELDMEGFRAELAALIAAVQNDTLFTRTQFIVEPGRYLVGEAGVYVTHINDIKTSYGKKFLIVDGGMHHHLAASGNLGQVIKRNFPVALLNKLQAPSSEIIDLVGPLCTPLDTLARDVLLPAADIGDLVGIFQSGAYARTASPLGFLSHPTPPEVWVRDGKAELIRPRGSYRDYLEDRSL